MPHLQTIETERFILRELEISDAPGMFALDSDSDVHKYLGNNPVTELKQSIAAIEIVRNQYIKNGIGRWAIIDKITNDFLGWTGLKWEEQLRSEFSYYDIGYRIRKEYWGKGIATETAIASLKFGFEKMNLKEISAAADVGNIASNRVLQKIGMKQVETFYIDNDKCNWYTIKQTNP